MKRSQLRADPAKTREWQERSRERARERAQGREGAKSSALRGATPPGDFRDDTGAVVPQRQALRPRKPDKLTPVRFKPREPARKRKCMRCGKRADGWHHWLPQQHIRTYVRGLGWPDVAARKRLSALLADQRNLVALCHPCHDSHELRSCPLSGEEVPHSARVFALSLGPEWAERLRRMYPGGLRA